MTEQKLCECGCGKPTNTPKYDNPFGGIAGKPNRFVHGHHMRYPIPTYIVDEKTSCWLWQGSMYTLGYGRLYLVDRNVKAHRWMWEKLRGPIPEGLVIDHLCNVRRCVNPDHLEPVTQKVNMQRAAARKRKTASVA